MTKDIATHAKEVATSEQVQQKVLDMLDQLQQGAVMVGDTVVKYAPDMADTMLMIVKIDGIQRILEILMALITGLLLLYATRKSRGHQIRIDPRCDTPFIMIPISLGIGGVIATLTSICAFINIWTWMAIFEPKLWLAKQILNKALE